MIDTLSLCYIQLQMTEFSVFVTTSQLYLGLYMSLIFFSIVFLVSLACREEEVEMKSTSAVYLE